MQNILPTLEFVGVVEPVFTEHWKNVIVNDGVQPLLGANIPAAEVAVANAESFTQRFIEGNLTIKVFYFIDEFIQRFIVQTVLVLNEALGIKARLHLKETETTTERIVDHGEAAVCRVHHADDVKVLRHRE